MALTNAEVIKRIVADMRVDFEFRIEMLGAKFSDFDIVITDSMGEIIDVVRREVITAYIKETILDHETTHAIKLSALRQLEPASTVYETGRVVYHARIIYDKIITDKRVQKIFDTYYSEHIESHLP